MFEEEFRECVVIAKITFDPQFKNDEETSFFDRTIMPNASRSLDRQIVSRETEEVSPDPKNYHIIDMISWNTAGGK